MIKSRRIILAFILILLTFLSAFMSYSSFAEEKTSNFLSLKQAEDEAIKNSTLIKESLRDIENFSDEYKKAYREERKVKKDKDSSGTLDYIQYESGYNSKKADIKINEIKLKIKKDEEKIKLDVLSLYQDILLKQKEIEIAKENIEIDKKLLDASKIKHSLGKISSYELEKSKDSYDALNIDLDTKNQELEDLYKKLNLLRGVSLDDRAVLSINTMEKYTDEIISPNDALEAALKNRYDVSVLKNEYTLAELDLKNTSVIYPENTYMYNEKERILNNSKEKYEEIQDRIKEEIENSYSSILTCNLKSEDIKLSLNKIKKDIDQKSTLFKYGRISEMELKNSKRDLLSKEFEYMQNLFEYQKNLKTYIISYEFGK